MSYMTLCMSYSESIRSSPVNACLDSKTFKNTPCQQDEYTTEHHDMGAQKQCKLDNEALTSKINFAAEQQKQLKSLMNTANIRNHLWTQIKLEIKLFKRQTSIKSHLTSFC